MESMDSQGETTLTDSSGLNTMVETTEEILEGDNYICISRPQYEKMIKATEMVDEVEKVKKENNQHLHEESHKQWGELKKSKLEFVHQQHLEAFGGLIKIPHLRQYFRGNVLVRENIEHKTSYLELFYDLIFVAAVSQIGHVLHHPSALHVGVFCVLFFSVWRIWTDTTIYMNYYATEDLLNKIFFLLVMMGLLGMSINSQSAYEDSKEGWVISFIVCRSVQIFMLVWVMYWIPESRAHAGGRILLMIIGIIPWIISYFIEDHKIPPILWTIGLVLEYALYSVWPYIRKLRIPLNIEHFTERHALFLTIALGETFLSTGRVFNPVGISHDQKVDAYVAAFLGVVLVLTIHWIYFDVEAFPQTKVFQHALRRDRRLGQVWSATHVILCASIIVLAAGHNSLLTGIISGEHEGHGNDFGKWLICSGVTIVLLCLTVIGLLHCNCADVKIPKMARLGVRVIVAIAVVLIPLSHLKSVHIIIVVTALTVTLVIIEIYGSQQRGQHKRKNQNATGDAPKIVKKDMKEISMLFSVE